MNLSDLIGAVISKNHRKERDCRKEQMVGLLFGHCFFKHLKKQSEQASL